MNQTMPLFEIILDENVLVVSFKAPYINDISCLDELEDHLREILSDYEQRFLLMDFSDLDLICSRMINSFLQLVKRVRAEGGQVHLCSLDAKVERVFKTMKLDRVFDMYDNREEGLGVMKALEQRYRMAQFV